MGKNKRAISMAALAGARCGHRCRPPAEDFVDDFGEAADADRIARKSSNSARWPMPPPLSFRHHRKASTTQSHRPGFAASGCCAGAALNSARKHERRTENRSVIFLMPRRSMLAGSAAVSASPPPIWWSLPRNQGQTDGLATGRKEAVSR